MKETVTTGKYTRIASHSFRHSSRNYREIEEPLTINRQEINSGLERFCKKYGKNYCERCLVEDCVRRKE